MQQLFRSAANASTPGQPNGTPLPQHMPPFMAQNAYAAAAAAAAAQQSPYVLNPGQDPTAPYMGLIPGMHQYYGVGPWVYPGIIPQQGSQPRRPLTPSQGTDNAPYQVCNQAVPRVSPLLIIIIVWTSVYRKKSELFSHPFIRLSICSFVPLYRIHSTRTMRIL